MNKKLLEKVLDDNNLFKAYEQVYKNKGARPNQIKYLGFGFYYTKTGMVKPKPHLKSIQKFKRKL